MGRKVKSIYARTATTKFRLAPEHQQLVADVRGLHPGLSEADVWIYALEEYAARHYKGKLKAIPSSQVKQKSAAKGRTGREIIIGKTQ